MTRQIIHISIFAAILLTLAAGAAGAQSLGDRHVERSGKFSIEPPAGWSSERPGGRGFHRFTNERDDTFPTSLNFTLARGVLDLDDFADQTAERMVTEYATAEIDAVNLDSRAKFVTADGLIGRRAIFTMTRGENKFISVQYFFIDERKNKYIITFLDTADRRAASMKLFDAVAGSFRLEP